MSGRGQAACMCVLYEAQHTDIGLNLVLRGADLAGILIATDIQSVLIGLHDVRL